ncbi:MAG: hypothetical protein HYZ44_06145 [Bacteroidetes bacterium]|nr:hypothetical protein [Bacteroidota bacterium]
MGKNRLDTIRAHFVGKLPVYVISGVLVGLMCFYYFVYLPKNEQHLNEHVDRLLTNKSQTIYEKYKGYENALNSSSRTYFAKWLFETRKTDVALNFLEIKDTTYYQFSKPVLNNGFKRIVPSDLLKAPLDPKLKSQIHGPSKELPHLSLWQVASGNNHFVFELPGDFLAYSEQKKKPKDKVVQHPYLWISANTFTSNLKSSDFFDDLFLVSIYEGDSAHPSTKVSGFVKDGMVIDKSQLGLTKFIIPDSIKVAGVGIFNRKIAGETYRIYVKRLHLQRNLDVFVVGLIDNSKFKTMATDVPAWFVIFCIVIVLALIFLMPLIKLYALNQNERLSAADARLSVFSMILIVSLVTIILAGSYVFWSFEKEEVDQKLKDLTKNIKDSTNNQISNLKSLISDPSIFKIPVNDFKNKYSEVKYYNEIFSLDTKGNTLQVIIGDEKLDDIFKVCPYNLSKRDYFQNIRSAQANKETIDYSLVSINSFSSGSSEAALSIDWKNDTIRVVTASIPAIIRSVIPAPYQFAVLDKTGDVKFHSDWKELQFENFVSECDNNQQLQAMIQNGITGEVDFSYLINDCQGYGTPLVKDWYLMVYYEKQTLRNLAAEVFGLCIITILIIALLLWLIQFALAQDRYHVGLIKTQSFFYHWLNPNSSSIRKWMALTFFNLYLFTCQTIWSFLFNSLIASIFFIFLSILAFYVIGYGCLNEINKKNIFSSRTMWWLVLLSLSVLIALLAAGWILQSFRLVIFLALFLSGLAICARLFQKWQWTLFKSWKPYLGFRAFLASSLLVMAVGPSWTFLTDHYYFASLSYQYSSVLHDVKKTQAYTSHHHTVENYAGVTSPPSVSEFEYKTQDQPDIDLYKYLQEFKSSAESLDSYSFNRVLNAEPYQIGHTDKDIIAQTKSGKPLIQLEKPLHKIAVKHNWMAVMVTLLAILTGVLIWQSLGILPHKIFYSPVVDLWAAYPAKKGKKNFIEQELENDDDVRHPLFNLDEEVKKEWKDQAKAEYDTPGLSRKEKIAVQEKYLLQLESKAQEQYKKALNGCSEEEKYFLFDLASDGVTNFANEPIIGSLAGKKLIRLTPALEIVNRSFAQYVLNNITAEEITKWEEKEDSQGNWNNLKLILVIVISVAFVFLSFTIEGFMGRVSALLAPLGLILPKVVSLISNYSSLPKQAIK